MGKLDTRGSNLTFNKKFVPLSTAQLTEAEINVLDGASSSAPVAGKAAVFNSSAYLNLTASNGNVGTCTLTASAATTAVANTSVSANSIIVLTPTSANAASDFANGLYISAKTAGTSFTITHPNNANADKTFNYIIFN